MKRIAVPALLLGGPVAVPAALTAADAPPPLLDRELFFGNPEIAAAQLSPDGRYVAFLKPWKDTRNVWVKKTEEPYAAARLLTTEAHICEIPEEKKEAPAMPGGGGMGGMD
mgnify:CR=1 FL=1